MTRGKVSDINQAYGGKKWLLAVGGARGEPGCCRFKVSPGRVANMQVFLLKDGIFWYTDSNRDLVTSQSASFFFENKIGDRLKKFQNLTNMTVAASDTNFISSVKCCDRTV